MPRNALRDALGNRTYHFTRRTDQVFHPATFDDTLKTWSNVSYTSSLFSLPANSDSNFRLLAFRMEELPNDTEFSNLFRYYRLEAVKVNLINRFNVSLNEYGTKALPVFMYSIAPDMTYLDAPTTAQQLRERSNLKMKFIGDKNNQRSVSIYLKPRVTPELRDLAGNTGASVLDYNKAKWFSWDNKIMEHTGLLLNFDTSHISTETIVDVEVKYYFSCAGTQ